MPSNNRNFFHYITKRHLVWFAIIIISCAIVVGLVAVPPRHASWNDESGLTKIGKFFSNIFAPQPITVLVLGRAGDTYNGGSLTDSLLVVRFDPDKKTVFFISIPRDLWVTGEQDEQYKLNEAYHRNQVSVALEKARAITGFDLDGYVVIDLALAKDMVDGVGGVDVVLTQPATDWVSGYVMEAGAHHLNGDDAVWLMRNRYNPEGDFFREGNQQQILDSILTKVKTMNTEQKLSFIKTFIINKKLLEHVNVGISRVTPYILDPAKLSGVRTKNIVLDFTTKLFTSSFVPVQGPTSTLYSSVLLPAEGFEKYDQIRAYINEKINSAN
ncbi:MAG: LCP family protein [Patescibacteria group bacterium]|nr:LCP family protein [Patescibacteria group bacterium]